MSLESFYRLNAGKKLCDLSEMVNSFCLNIFCRSNSAPYDMLLTVYNQTLTHDFYIHYLACIATLWHV